MTKYLGFQYSDLSGRLLYFSTGQRSCPQSAWDRAAVNVWNTRLHRSSSVASQQSWPEPRRLPNWEKLQERVCRSLIRDVDVIGERRFSQGVLRWTKHAVAPHLHILELAFEHAEDILNTNLTYVWYLYRRTLWQSYMYICYIIYNDMW